VAPSVELDELNIAIDRHAEVPIGVQLAWALRARIRDGRLKPGNRLPGLRDLAGTLGVNANTVRSVYQRLEQEGVVESQQGNGTFVASTPADSVAVGTIAANAAREAHETGVDPREVAAALYVASESVRAADHEQAERRKRLRAQIGVLEQALAELELRHPNLVAPASEKSPRAQPRLLDARELEHIQTQLLRRLSRLQTAIDELSEDRGEDGGPPARKAKRTSTAPPDATRRSQTRQTGTKRLCSS
jgi:DNA-binding transcriptional regulator YhcF (GntR family)